MLAEYFCEVCIRFRSLEASTIFLSQYVLGRNFSKAIHEPPGSSESYKSLVNIMSVEMCWGAVCPHTLSAGVYDSVVGPIGPWHCPY